MGLPGKLKNLALENLKLEPDIEKTGKITQVLTSGQQILVQIAKEPISTKGPRLTSEISFAGRYLVLVPFSNRISISQKVKNSEERSRLKRLISSIKPVNFGVIIRTVAENKMVAELHADLNGLLEKWNGLTKVISGATAPQKVVSELSRTSAILRDLLNENFNHVHVNNPIVFDEVRSYIKTIAPHKADIVKLYKGKAPIFEFFGLEKQIKNSFGKIVTIKSGVYLIIEHTEALHVIDVNSGHRVNKENSQEANALEVNLESATEIARQLRLRDMGGIIVVDFIDMNEGVNRRKLFEKLKEEMSRDSAKHSILPPSKFGLVQITRQRVRPEMNISVLEKCPVCDGTGEAKPSIMIIDEIENNLRYLVQDQNERGLTLNVHPYVYSHLKSGFKSIRLSWCFKYKRWIHLHKSSSYHMLEYHFFNKSNDEIKM
ncbi:MAG: Rne/Rng family ribonuclease [Bacteroidales bacterium]|nr:Rne/Rng family ribonuclease [Bacteroidales bacterium]